MALAAYKGHWQITILQDSLIQDVCTELLDCPICIHEGGITDSQLHCYMS